MIEGDIDLTENLDFYREKKTLEDKVYLQGSRGYRKPRIPWKKRPPKLSLKSLAKHEDNQSSYQPTTTSSSNTSLYWTTNSWSYTLPMVTNTITNISDNMQLFGIASDYYDYNYNSTYSIGVDMWNDSTGITITYNGSNNGVDAYSLKADVKREVFPSRKSFVKFLKDIIEQGLVQRCHECKRYFFSYKNQYSGRCPDCRKSDYFEDSSVVEAIKTIRRSCKRRNFIERMCYDRDLAWGVEGHDSNDDYVIEFDDWHWLFADKMIRSDILHHIGVERRDMENEKRPIPWLRKLSYRIYNDYMKSLYEDDVDYSKYLTNMGWIGVHKTEHVYEDSDIDDDTELVLHWNNDTNNWEIEEVSYEQRRR